MGGPRVLVLSDLWVPFPGGAERLVFNLSRDLMRRGFDVRAVTGYAAFQRFDGPPVRWIGADRIETVLRRARPDVVLAHHVFAYQYEQELHASGVPLVQVVLNTRRIGWAHHAVYISQWVRDLLGDSVPSDQTITPPAFDDVVAVAHGNKIGMIKPLWNKGVDLFYEVADLMPDREFVVLRGEWQNLEDIRAVENVTFMDPVADIRDFYAECRMVLMPSTVEDAGTVAQECALNDIPCLSSGIGGLTETNGGTVLLDRDTALWAAVLWEAAIRDLDDPDLYRKVTARQRDHLASLNHPQLLAELAVRVGALADGTPPE